jgi:glycosyltransferase A (GT-A) superfamily protein (DUF2064 family)
MSGAGVLILAEEPVAGDVKPRLASLLGEDGCVRLERELIRAALRWGDTVAPGRTWLAMTGHHDCPLAESATKLEPRQGDIGERMRAAVAEIYVGGHHGPLFVIGTDCPQLGPEHAATALGELAAGRDAVILPGRAGGFCMVLVKEAHPELMRMPADAWHGPALVDLMLAAGRAAGLDVTVMAMENALAGPDDARAARADGRVPESVRAALMTEPLVSIVIPVLDDDATLGGALDALAALPGRFQVVVVDGGSRDATVEIARQYAARVLHNPRPGYRAQKQFALDAATSDWVLNLDADERVSDELANEIRRELAKVPDDVDGFAIPRLVGYLGRWWWRGGWYPRPVPRLVRREHTTWGGTDPHDRAEVLGRVVELKAPIFHYTYEDVQDHLRSVAKLTAVAERQVPPGRHVGVSRLALEPAWRFLRAYFLRGALWEGMPGFFVAATDAFYLFLRWTRVWVRERRT